MSASPRLSRPTQVITLVAITFVAVGVLVLGGLARPASAQSTTRPTRPQTTEPPPEPTEPPTTRARPTLSRPTTTARLQTTQTTRRSATPGPAAGPTRGPTTAATTDPTTPASTETPALLVPGPNNTMPGAPQTASEGVSTNAALRWVVAGLVAVAGAITALTVAFWRHTKPTPEGGGEPGDNGDTGWDPGPDPDVAPGYTTVAGAGWGAPTAVDHAYRPQPQPQYAPGATEPDETRWGSY